MGIYIADGALKGLKLAIVIPSGTITYSETEWTKENVVATLHTDTGKTYYTFYKNGEFEFKYTNVNGEEKSAIAKVENIDKTEPTAGTLTMKLVSEENEYANDIWTNESVYIELNEGSDELSGHKSTTYSINGGEPTNQSQIIEEQGIYEIIVTTKDNVGNKATNKYTIKIDKTAPTAGTLTMKLGNSEGNEYINNIWTEQSVYLALNNGEDKMPGSGHKLTTYKINEGEETTKEQILTESGEYNIVVTTKDNGGNTTTNEYKVKIRKVESILVTKNSEKFIYKAYENFDSTGMRVSIKYDNGDIEEETEYIIRNGEQLTCQSPSIEIQYKQNPEIYAELTLNVEHDIDEATCTEEAKCKVDGCAYIKEGSELGHSFVNYASNNDATCIKDGTKTAKCERCDVTDTVIDEGSKKSHTEVIDARVEPTCTKTGLTEGKHCEVCKTVIVEQQEIEALGHNYEEQVINPTCAEKGYTTHQCTRCEDIYIDTYTEELNHSFTNYVSNGDATCTKDGTQTAKCDRCDVTNTETDEGSKKPHLEVVDAKVEPTCTTTGLTEGKHCEVCKEVILVQTTISELGHNYESKVTSPQCTEQGYTIHQCTRCKDNYVDAYIKSLGHCFTNYVSNNDATCTQEETKTAKCDRCDVMNTVTEEGKKGPHNYQNGICTECREKEPKLEIAAEKYNINDLYITKTQAKTTIEQFKQNIETNATEVNVYNKQNEKKENSDELATGMTVEFKFGNKIKTLIIVVTGDVNGDGKIKLTDMSMINRHRLNKSKLNGTYLLAADVTEDGKVNFLDLVKLNRIRLNKIL